VSICCEVGPDCVWEKELDCVVDGFVVACFVVVVGGGGGTVVMEANVEVVVSWKHGWLLHWVLVYLLVVMVVL